MDTNQHESYLCLFVVFVNRDSHIKGLRQSLARDDLYPTEVADLRRMVQAYPPYAGFLIHKPEIMMHDHFMKHGVFSWNELMTTDLEAAKGFYSGMFGWTFEESTMTTGETYVVARDGDAMLAGLFLKTKDVPEHIPPHWGAYVTVDDVDASAKQAKALGAAIVLPPTDIPGVGRFCVVQDPQGAAFSIITYEKNGECANA